MSKGCELAAMKGEQLIEMVESSEQNFRISTCPGLHGEKVVIRLLGKAGQKGVPTFAKTPTSFWSARSAIWRPPRSLRKPPFKLQQAAQKIGCMSLRVDALKRLCSDSPRSKKSRVRPCRNTPYNKELFG